MSWTFIWFANRQVGSSSSKCHIKHLFTSKVNKLMFEHLNSWGTKILEHDLIAFGIKKCIVDLQLVHSSPWSLLKMDKKWNIYMGFGSSVQFEIINVQFGRVDFGT
jgi:hypothetical protein